LKIQKTRSKRLQKERGSEDGRGGGRERNDF
jgi:hypothetical protein